jgi:hypothetical protein
VIEDPSPPRLQFDPNHPLADARGYVTMPNVDAVEEMVNMISASRAYQTNADVMNAAKTMTLRTLSLPFCLPSTAPPASCRGPPSAAPSPVRPRTKARTASSSCSSPRCETRIR